MCGVACLWVANFFQSLQVKMWRLVNIYWKYGKSTIAYFLAHHVGLNGYILRNSEIVSQEKLHSTHIY